MASFAVRAQGGARQKHQAPVMLHAAMAFVR
jgi:hypothetical protein